MKKLLLFFFTISTLSNFYSQCTPVFYDGFESGNYTPTWTLGSTFTSATVNTSNPYSGNYKFEGVGGGSSHLSGMSTEFAAATPNTITWHIYPTGSSASNYLVAGDNTTTANNCIVFCYWVGGNSIRFVNNAGSLNYPATPNQWYKIELKNINWITRTFDIYINSVLYQANYAFRSATISTVSRIYLYNFTAGSTGIWDEINLGGMQLNTISTSVTCNGGSNGSASVSVQGGQTPFTYSWTPSSSTGSVANSLTAGLYSVTVVDANTCVASTTINISQPPAITLTTNQNSVSCNLMCDGSATINASGGTGSFTYNWLPSGFGNDIDSLCAGNYTCLVTDANSCSANQTVSIIQPSSLTTTISTQNINCLNSTGQATCIVNGGTSPYTYSWSTNSSTTNIANNLTTGIYTCTITDFNNCILNQTVNVSSDTIPPNINITGTLTICSGQISTLTAVGANSYSWSVGSTSVSILVSPTTNTTYSVIGTNSVNGCSNTAVVTVTVSNCTRINETENNLNLVNIYPNPSNGIYKISCEENIEVFVSDFTGKNIKFYSLQKGNSIINLNEMPNGIYFLMIKNNKTHQQTLKLIKQ